MHRGAHPVALLLKHLAGSEWLRVVGEPSQPSLTELGSQWDIPCQDGAGCLWVKSEKDVAIVEEAFPSHPSATGIKPEGEEDERMDTHRVDKDGKSVCICVSSA